METVSVTCTNPLCRFRFLINLKKHLNRRERFCPRCHTEVKVRRRFKFLSNPEWQKQREEAEANRRYMKAMKRKESERGPAIALPNLSEGLLALSLLLKRQAESEKQTSEK